jgi:WD40 repeat protein
VKVWDAIGGEELLSLFGHQGVATGVEFSPDGTWLISSGTDGVIRGYTLDIDLLKELAKEKLTRSLTEEECQKYLHLDACPDDS